MTSTPQSFGTTFSSIPQGHILGRYTDYQDAQKVVDYLADHDFPVKNVSIIGNGLKLVERVSGKLTYPKVAMQGAMQGGMIGLFFALVMLLFSPQGSNATTMAIGAVLIGAVLWMIFGIIQYAARRGKRDFASTRQVLPSTWDVVVNHEVMGQAQAMLSNLPQRPASMPVDEQGSQAGGFGGSGNTSDSGGHSSGYQASSGQGYPEQGYGSHRHVDQASNGNTQTKPPERSADPFYSDLDDGRPRFGVRREDVSKPQADDSQPHQAEAPSAQESHEQAQGQQETEPEQQETEPGQQQAQGDVGEGRD